MNKQMTDLVAQNTQLQHSLESLRQDLATAEELSEQANVSFFLFLHPDFLLFQGKNSKSRAREQEIKT